jgi:predicted nuclease with RNAse H fold
MNVIGIDMASAKPCTCAVLDDKLRFLLYEYDNWRSVLHIAKSFGCDVFALDSPLGFPRGMCCLEESCPCKAESGLKGRAAERELSKLGIGSYYSTKRSFIKPMIYKSIQWAKELRAAGFQVIEIYPYASKVRLFGKPVPNKATRFGLMELRKKVVKLGFKLDGYLNHDQIDALIAAYTALLYVQGKTIEVGDPAESTIVIPDLSASAHAAGDGDIWMVAIG